MVSKQRQNWRNYVKLCKMQHRGTRRKKKWKRGLQEQRKGRELIMRPIGVPQKDNRDKGEGMVFHKVMAEIWANPCKTQLLRLRLVKHEQKEKIKK